MSAQDHASVAARNSRCQHRSVAVGCSPVLVRASAIQVPQQGVYASAPSQDGTVLFVAVASTRCSSSHVQVLNELVKLKGESIRTHLYRPHPCKDLAIFVLTSCCPGPSYRSSLSPPSSRESIFTVVALIYVCLTVWTSDTSTFCCKVQAMVVQPSTAAVQSH